MTLLELIERNEKFLAFVNKKYGKDELINGEAYELVMAWREIKAQIFDIEKKNTIQGT